jgi:hypothetical protein
MLYWRCGGLRIVHNDLDRGIITMRGPDPVLLACVVRSLPSS